MVHLVIHCLINFLREHPKNTVVNTNPVDGRVDKIVNRRENTFQEYVERWTYTVEEGFEFDVMNGKVQLDRYIFLKFL